jgi:hypothetical protein
MKAPQLLTYFGLALAIILQAGSTYAFQVGDGKNKLTKDDPAKRKAVNSKFKFDKASTLSGIELQPKKTTGTFLLTFDQHLTETGTLLVKNIAGKVLYTSLIIPDKTQPFHSMDIGKLTPGVYSIEVKTSDMTFWKKVRIRR